MDLQPSQIPGAHIRQKAQARALPISSKSPAAGQRPGVGPQGVENLPPGLQEGKVEELSCAVRSCPSYCLAQLAVGLHSPSHSEHPCTPLGLAWTHLVNPCLQGDWQRSRTTCPILALHSVSNTTPQDDSSKQWVAIWSPGPYNSTAQV